MRPSPKTQHFQFRVLNINISKYFFSLLFARSMDPKPCCSPRLRHTDCRCSNMKTLTLPRYGSRCTGVSATRHHHQRTSRRQYHYPMLLPGVPLLYAALQVLSEIYWFRASRASGALSSRVCACARTHTRTRTHTQPHATYTRTRTRRHTHTHQA